MFPLCHKTKLLLYTTDGDTSLLMDKWHGTQCEIRMVSANG